VHNKTPKRSDSEETRKKILDVCLDLFAREGFDGTGIDAIARTAGIAKSLIYYHFKNKDDILEALLERYMDEAVETKRQTMPEFMKDPAGNLRNAIGSALDMMENDRNLIRIMMMESLKESGFEKVNPHMRRGMAAGFDAIRHHGGKDFDETDLTLKAQFFGFMPLATFVLFVDKWCEDAGLDPKWARERFLDTFTDIYLHIMKEIFSASPERTP
jgi:AcrR family transcriptional regulator